MYKEGLLGTIISFLTLVRAEWNTKDFQKREHSLVKPYQGSGFGVPNWDFQVSQELPFFSYLNFSDQQPISSVWLGKYNGDKQLHPANSGSEK